ncbi:uncharacterized protein MCYG_00764 [Microsporum canis CBS 113480]|uniref:Uncharacterized protein n=1 Tax=Arthroderma otae (strain ATCC MYA-4605 / CBS 113480) TaxID=554155 RepID=C5FDT0_ARTOC|nr:uncharacterized protein MCYG_00764 [Microsporum canis CBS 113480]EEQ27876.1 predicted protein [Microsporum canis CBS 113480]
MRKQGKRELGESPKVLDNYVLRTSGAPGTRFAALELIRELRPRRCGTEALPVIYVRQHGSIIFYSAFLSSTEENESNPPRTFLFTLWHAAASASHVYINNFMDRSNNAISDHNNRQAIIMPRPYALNTELFLVAVTVRAYYRICNDKKPLLCTCYSRQRLKWKLFATSHVARHTTKGPAALLGKREPLLPIVTHFGHCAPQQAVVVPSRMAGVMAVGDGGATFVHFRIEDGQSEKYYQRDEVIQAEQIIYWP